MVITDVTTKLRPFTLDDAQACVDLFNACSQHLYGCDDSELNELMTEWTSPGLDVNQMIRVVEDQESQVIGYIDVWDITSPHVVKWIWGVLHPNHWDEGLYARMLDWAEGLACERIFLAPEGARVIMKQGTPSKDLQRKKALEQHGFTLSRYFYRMQIELGKAPQKPELPEGLRIVPIDMESEFRKAILAMDEAFQDHWGHVAQPAEELLAQWKHFIENEKDFDPSLWFLAKEGDQIAGICRCSGKTVEDPDMGWVNQLCVLKPWRRRGLGMALLLTAFNAFYKRGKARAALAVDASSLTKATQLYEKAGMHVTRQYNTYEKELRPGIELATQDI